MQKQERSKNKVQRFNFLTVWSMAGDFYRPASKPKLGVHVGMLDADFFDNRTWDFETFYPAFETMQVVVVVSGPAFFFL